jgi:F0F1-type ATP synthase assembly protein I
MPENPEAKRDFTKWIGLAAAGGIIFAPIVIGSILDHQFGWRNWGVLVGVVVGFVAGLSYLLVVLKQFQDPPDKPERNET